MNEMIERVARVLFERGRAEGNIDPETWETASQEMRDWLSGHACAVIGAMREPTEAMVSAGWAVNGWRGDMTQAEWTAMINAALPPERPSTEPSRS